MREIKFRAWTGEKMRRCSVSEKGMAVMDWGESQAPLMQFTGLKDKNGVDIYEGDIITTPHGDKGPVVVEWGEVSDDLEHPFAFGWKIGSCLLGSDINGNYQYTEVIGNIYQNPELLK